MNSARASGKSGHVVDWRHPSLCQALWAAALLSLLLSFLAWLLHDNINHDGVKFVDSAVRFQQDGMAGALAVYRWPAYPVLIGTMAWIPGLSAAAAAHLLNATMLALLSASFIMICREVYGSINVNAGAMVVILTLPAVNEYRDYIIRDLSSWSLLAFSFWQLFRYQRLRDWGSATLWQAGLIGAFLFKMEAVAFAALVPLYFLLQQNRSAGLLHDYLRLNWLALLGLCLLLLLSLATRDFADISRAEELIAYLDLGAATAGFEGRVAALQEHVLSSYTRSYADVMWLGALAGLLLYKVLSKLGVAHVGLMLLIRRSGLQAGSKEVRLLFWLSFVALLILVAFTLQRFYIAGRYPVVLTILLCVPLAGVVQGLLTRPHIVRRLWLRNVLWFLLLFVLLDPFVQTGPRKTFLRDSGEWVMENYPATARVFSNYPALYYYSGRTAYREESDVNSFDLDRAISELEEYDLLVLAEDALTTEHKSALARNSRLKLLRRFGHPERVGVKVYAVEENHGP